MKRLKYCTVLDAKLFSAGHVRQARRLREVGDKSIPLKAGLADGSSATALVAVGATVASSGSMPYVQSDIYQWWSTFWSNLLQAVSRPLQVIRDLATASLQTLLWLVGCLLSIFRRRRPEQSDDTTSLKKKALESTESAESDGFPSSRRLSATTERARRRQLRSFRRIFRSAAKTGRAAEEKALCKAQFPGLGHIIDRAYDEVCEKN